MSLWRTIVLVGLMAVPALPQNVDPEKWNTVERMCGKAEWVDEIPAKGKTAESEEKAKPLRKARVRLYFRKNEPSCCEPKSLIGQVVTGKKGEFEFLVKDLFPGKYWVTVDLDGKRYSLPINYLGSKVEVSCSDILYDVNKGELQLRRTVHVD
jgi:hypothetical protein